MFKCEICGKECEKHQWIPGEFYNICSDECFNTKFWQLIIAEKEKHLIINNECYCIGDKNNGFLGFGGKQFTIKTAEGRIIETNNLWFQGDIPEEFRDQLPNNAEFI